LPADLDFSFQPEGYLGRSSLLIVGPVEEILLILSRWPKAPMAVLIIRETQYEFEHNEPRETTDQKCDVLGLYCRNPPAPRVEP
jgi:hypothetical protein